MPLLLRNRWLSLALVFCLLEGLAGLACRVWDSKHPQFESSALFEVRGDPDGKSADEWMAMIQKSIATSGVIDWSINRRRFYFESDTNLAGMYRTFTRSLRNLFTKNTDHRLYVLSVTAADPVTASNQANQAIVTAQKETAARYSEILALKKAQWLKEMEAAAQKARLAGNQKVVDSIELSITTERMMIVCFSPFPMRIWQRAEADQRPLSMFATPATQVGALVLTMLASFSQRALKPDSSTDPSRLPS
jgi:hypothetical protein